MMRQNICDNYGGVTSLSVASAISSGNAELIMEATFQVASVH